MNMFKKATQGPGLDELLATEGVAAERERVALASRLAVTPLTKPFQIDDLDRELVAARIALELARRPLADALREKKLQDIVVAKAAWRAAALVAFPLIAQAREAYAPLLAAEIRLKALGVVDGDDYCETAGTLTPALSPATPEFMPALELTLAWAKGMGLLK